MHDILLVTVGVLVTMATRFLPFLIFGENRKTPPIVEHLSKTLPFAIMGMLMFYCLKDVTLTCAPFGIPEFLGCTIVAGLHIWKRNTLLSIGAGTICYMLMVQYLF